VNTTNLPVDVLHQHSTGDELIETCWTALARLVSAYRVAHNRVAP
jgi:hypothetical protein